VGAAETVVPAGVETEAGYDEEDVVAAGVDGDPTAGTALAVMTEGDGGLGGIEEAGGPEDEGSGAGAVVGGVELGVGMTGAVDVRETCDAVAGGDGDLDDGRGGGRGDGVAVTEDCGVAGDVVVDVGRRGGAAGEEKEEKEEGLMVDG
jgi:hypothetical protein